MPRADDAPPADGGILLVDKPAGCTSHDVVGRVRYLLGTRRVGHAGTLDPMATGLLVIGVERSTRLLGHLALSTKSYRATIRLGQSRTTDDAEGAVLSTTPVDIDDAAIEAGVAALSGDLWQRPSSVSAIKVEGRRAYARVRAGEEVELAARSVTVARFTVDAPPRRIDGFVDLDVTVDCSTGTYIRALARDLGAALNVGGHLTALRRTAVGPFTVADAVDVYGPGGREPRVPGERTPPPAPLVARARVALQTPLSIARAVFPIRQVSAELAVDVGHGRPIPADRRAGIVAVVADDRLLALMSDRGDTARPVLVWSPA